MLPIQEVVALFDLPQILRHNARFDLTKLNWLNYEHIRALSAERFAQSARQTFGRAGIDVTGFDKAYVSAALATCKDKVKLFSDLPAYAGFYFQDEVVYEAEAARKDFTPENKPRLAKLRAAFAQADRFDADALQNILKAVAAELGVKAGVLVHPARLACTGQAAGPSLYHLLEVLGKKRVLDRLDRALAVM